tara:strand:- start:14019 stop:14426 length:408 start_codon:yes stop_codon:yes gene_type:complete
MTVETKIFNFLAGNTVSEILAGSPAGTTYSGILEYFPISIELPIELTGIDITLYGGTDSFQDIPIGYYNGDNFEKTSFKVPLVAEFKKIDGVTNSNYIKVSLRYFDLKGATHIRLKLSANAPADCSVKIQTQAGS